jgi:hypothetical protein
VRQSQSQEVAQTSSVGAEKVEETSQEQTAPLSADEVKSSKPSQEGEGGRLQKRIAKLEEKLETAKTQEDRDRISALIGRLKSKAQATQEVPPELLQSEPLIKPEEYGAEIDPEELERRIAQREQTTVLKAIQAVESKRRYEGALQEHISDWEKVLQDPQVSQDPDLRDFVESQYRLANFVVNPFTGKEDFVPTLKPSEVYSKVKKILEKKATQVASQTYGELRQQAESQSPPPSVSKPQVSDAEEQALLNKAKSERSDEAWAAFLKRRLFKK